MEAWELDAREQIRDLVASYNAHGDRGRFDEVMTLFTDDAVMDVGDGHIYSGIQEIRTIFTETQESVHDGLDNDTTKPRYLQHHTAIPAITFESSDAARGQA